MKLTVLFVACLVGFIPCVLLLRAVPDNLTNQKMMLVVLRKLGYSSVLLAVDGQQAVDIYERELAAGTGVDIILMDVSMVSPTARPSAARRTSPDG